MIETPAEAVTATLVRSLNSSLFWLTTRRHGRSPPAAARWRMGCELTGGLSSSACPSLWPGCATLAYRFRFGLRPPFDFDHGAVFVVSTVPFGLVALGFCELRFEARQLRSRQMLSGRGPGDDSLTDRARFQVTDPA
ncbi:hypothetical protein ACWIG5_27155 [Streptomyces lydicus]